MGDGEVNQGDMTSRFQPATCPGMVLDIGGEGRHPEAWNLNPRPVKTLGNERGQPIPRHILGRAEAIPLADGSVDKIIVERTPLRAAALNEIARVIVHDGIIILRHVPLPHGDCHDLARRILPGQVWQRTSRVGSQVIQETEFRLAVLPHELRGTSCPI